MPETNDKSRIKLAKAMGWKEKTRRHGAAPGVFTYWDDPSGNYSAVCTFDPYTSADDCEALVRWLRGKGLFTNVYHGHQDRVRLFTDGKLPLDEEFWSGDPGDWKEGVCELACKVIDQVAREALTDTESSDD